MWEQKLKIKYMFFSFAFLFVYLFSLLIYFIDFYVLKLLIYVNVKTNKKK